MPAGPTRDPFNAYSLRMPDLFSPESLDMMRRIKETFDPQNRFNPGKVLPTGKGCMEIRQRPLVARETML